MKMKIRFLQKRPSENGGVRETFACEIGSLPNEGKLKIEKSHQSINKIGFPQKRFSKDCGVREYLAEREERMCRWKAARQGSVGGGTHFLF